MMEEFKEEPTSPKRIQGEEYLEESPDVKKIKLENPGGSESVEPVLNIEEKLTKLEAKNRTIISSKDNKIDQLTVQLDAVTQFSLTKKNENAELLINVASKNSKIEELKKKICALSDDLKSTKEIQNEIYGKNNELQTKIDKVYKIDCDAKNEEIRNLKTNLAAVQTHYKQKESELENMLQQYEELKNAIHIMDKSNERHKEQFKETLAEKEKELIEYKENINELKKLKELQKQQFENILDEKEKELAESRKNVNALHLEIQQLNINLNSLKEAESTLRKDFDYLNENLKKNSEKLQETNCNFESQKVINQNIVNEMQGLKSRNEEKDLIIANIKTKLEDKETDFLNLQESLREIQSAMDIQDSKLHEGFLEAEQNKIFQQEYNNIMNENSILQGNLERSEGQNRSKSNTIKKLKAELEQKNVVTKGKS